MASLARLCGDAPVAQGLTQRRVLTLQYRLEVGQYDPQKG